MWYRRLRLAERAPSERSHASDVRGRVLGRVDFHSRYDRELSFGIYETDCDEATLYRCPRSPASPPANGHPHDFLQDFLNRHLVIGRDMHNCAICQCLVGFHGIGVA
jgi:hypothetical protein